MAFNAVTSLAQILEQTLQHQRMIIHNRQQIESLLKDVSFLRDSLENSSQKNSKTTKSLESQIINAAYEAQDLVESLIKDQLIREKNFIISSQWFIQVQREIDSINQRVKKIEEDSVSGVEDLQPMITSPPGEISIVGLRDDVLEMKNRLTRASLELETLSIVGMAGIGKTIIATEVYNSSKAMYHFDTRAWVTVSQSYYVRRTVIDLLDSINRLTNEMRKESTEQLGEYLYKSLKDRRYLIVMDDVWDTKVWDDLSRLFPNDKNGSRVLLTTRLENVAVSTNSSPPVHRMNFAKRIQCRQNVILRNRQQAESLLKKVSLLQESLEKSSQKGSEKLKSLENQIINAATKIKDFTESSIMNYTLTFSPQCLKKVKREIDFVKQLAMRIEEESRAARICAPGACSSNPAAATGKTTMVGLHGDFMEIKNRLAGESSKLETFSLVGMGGFGKTTLAREVYNDKFIMEFFLIRAWVTISQSYDLRQILIGLLDSMENLPDEVHKKNVGDLAEHLHKSLKGRRYLIVIDDVWETKVWDDLRQLFPNDKNSSRILLTTRLENMAVYANSFVHHMHFLNEDGSWNLFCNKVFGEDYYCPLELEEVGKKIVQNCRGLPLSIIVTGGLLSTATKTQHYWRNVAENLSSVIISQSYDHCSKILSLSYTHLPQYLKECFLYTGIFPEDCNILVSKLVKLWVAEGLIEPRKSNSLDDIAYEYLLDLVDRSLILVDEQSSTGKIKTCKIHDLVRDFCTREAKKEMLFHINDKSLYGIPAGASVRRLSIHPNTTNIFPCDDNKLLSLEMSSLFSFDRDFHLSVHHLNPRPLKVLDMGKTGYNSGIEWELNELLFCNLQYLACYLGKKRISISSSSVLPNLQTLILYSFHPPMEVPIWNMPQLRHVKVTTLYLTDPTDGENSATVLQNLQTLSLVQNFQCSKEVLERIPNLKKLGICYNLERPDWDYYCLHNLVHLRKLEAFKCIFMEPSPSFLHKLTFPPSVKKLTLKRGGLSWKDMVIIGSLHSLEVLKLKTFAFEGPDWEPTEGEFLNLKFLLLKDLDLVHWRADSIHFPRLQRLIIKHCIHLKEIPCCIGEIPTLQLIELHNCADSLIDSVNEMQNEQLELGNDGLQVRVQLNSLRFSEDFA